MRLSPAILNTVPSYSNVIAVRQAKNSFNNSTTSVGGKRSEMPVKPRISANSTAASVRMLEPDSTESRKSGFARMRSAIFGEM